MVNKKNKKSKKSQSQVEMILSFVIFIGFVFAIFIILNPIKEKNLSSAVLDDTADKLIKNLSIDYSSISLILVRDPGLNCVGIVDIGTLVAPGNSIVKDISEKLEKSSRISGNQLNFEPNPYSRYYQIYFSNFFNSYPFTGGCAQWPITDYSYGALDSKKAVLFENLKKLNDSYMNDYSELKSALKIDNDFEYIVYDTNKNILFSESLSINRLKTRSVLSRDIPIKTINKSADIRDIVINLRVW